MWFFNVIILLVAIFSYPLNYNQIHHFPNSVVFKLVNKWRLVTTAISFESRKFLVVTSPLWKCSLALLERNEGKQNQAVSRARASGCQCQMDFPEKWKSWFLNLDTSLAEFLILSFSHCKHCFAAVFFSNKGLKTPHF